MRNSSNYVKEAERQRSNDENYRKINCDPTTANNETTQHNINTPHFYVKPKIHK